MSEYDFLATRLRCRNRVGREGDWRKRRRAENEGCVPFHPNYPMQYLLREVSYVGWMEEDGKWREGGWRVEALCPPLHLHHSTQTGG